MIQRALKFILVAAGVLVAILIARIVATVLFAVQYDVAVAATMSIDGRKFSQTQPYHCQILDYSWLYSTTPGPVQSGEPIYLIHDDGVVAIDGFSACRWLDGPPAPGATYRLLAELDRVPAGQRDEGSTDLAAGLADVVVLDDVDDPGRGQVYNLYDIERGLVPRLQLVGLSVASG